jgi:hypothetical protein
VDYHEALLAITMKASGREYTARTEQEYAEIKPALQEAWTANKAAGRTIEAFITSMMRQLGTGVAPYLKRFYREATRGAMGTDPVAAPASATGSHPYKPSLTPEEQRRVDALNNDPRVDPADHQEGLREIYLGATIREMHQSRLPRVAKRSAPGAPNG